MKVELNRAHYPVTVLGYGRRVGLWLQGCSIGCVGCIARDTWAPDPATRVEVSELVDWCASLPPAEVDGVTISGGEPFDQPEALAALLTGLRGWATAGGRDLLCYSGRSLAALTHRFTDILDLLDVVIPGPYVESEAPGKIWRGSANQELVPLTPLGHQRYDTEIDRPADRARMQATVDGSVIRYVGVPRPGDLDAISERLRRSGLIREQASWLS